MRSTIKIKFHYTLKKVCGYITFDAINLTVEENEWVQTKRQKYKMCLIERKMKELFLIMSDWKNQIITGKNKYLDCNF